MKKKTKKRLSRRSFLRRTSAGVLLAGSGVGGLLGCDNEPTSMDGGPMTDGAIGRRELRILTWENFVPAFDLWFDQFAADWGTNNNVDVTVEHVPIGDINGLLRAQLDAGMGNYDIIELLSGPADLEPQLVDLTDLNNAVADAVGAPVPLCRDSTFNPVTNRFFGFCHAWLPDPGNFRRNLWDGLSLPGGPTSWDQLATIGAQLRTDHGVPVGVGINAELDSNMANRSLLWSFDASVQDADRNVIINSPQTIEAIEYMTRLYTDAMTPDVLMWQPADNNNALLEERASYIVNSISAYRTAQESVPLVAEDVYFTSALAGPRGTALAAPHATIVDVIPNHSPNRTTAEDFLMHYAMNYSEAVFASKLYYFPAFPNTTPQLTESGGWLDADPFDSSPLNKLAVLKTAVDWSRPIGYPGSANPAIGQAFSEGIVPRMFAQAVRGDMTAAEAAQWAQDQIEPMFEFWRGEGLV